MTPRGGERRRRLALAGLDESHVMLFWLRPTGEFAFANEAAAHELGTTVAKLEGSPSSVLGAPFERNLLAAISDLPPGQKVRYETEAIRADGEPLLLGVSVLRTDFEGEPMFVLTAADLASQRETREKLRETQEMLFQAQKMEAIGRLAGGVAHDFNNLLAVVVGGMELLESPNLAPEDAEELRGEVRRAAERGARVTRQLLAFSRQQLVAPRVCSSQALLVDAEKVLRRLLGAGVELSVGVEEPELRFRIDPSQLEQVLINLAVNSRDAMPDGGRLEVRAGRRIVAGGVAGSHEPVPDGAYVSIAVRDTGTGMTPEVAGRLFEPFFTTKERGRGTGLGLATVYGIVRQADGWIAVETEPGRGTTFELLFPLVDEPSGERMVPAPGAIVGGGRRVLYVEDDADLRRLTIRMLVDIGFEVVTAKNAHDALEAVARQPRLDLLLSDVVLPGLNGLELAKQLATNLPDLRVAFVSGYAEDEGVLREIVDGGRILLSKPFTRSALARALELALAGPPFARVGAPSS